MTKETRVDHSQYAEPLATASENELVPPVACLDCGLPYADFPMDVSLPRGQWLTIHPDEHGVICAGCIVKRVRARMVGAVVIHMVVEVSCRTA
jgi:hypothetical protein